MRRRFIIASATMLMATLGVVHAGVSSAATSCDDGSSPVTSNVSGDLNVPAGKTCTLANLTVTGNVTVGAGASIKAKNTTIKGSFTATNAALVSSAGGNVVNGNVTLNGVKDINVLCPSSVSLAPVSPALTVGGNLVVKNGPSGGSFTNSGGTGFPCLKVAGNVSVTGNRYPIDVALTQAGGNITVSNNTAAMTIAGNKADGVLACSGNTPAPTGGGNTAAAKTGQCSGL